MISVQQLTKRFGAQTAVDNLSFEIPAGQIIGFLGPNGAGKSTTLKMLTGMLEPTSGTARVCGFDLRENVIEVKRHVGFVPESGAVFESLTGLEYLEMVAALYGIPADAARGRIQQFITFFDLSFETLTDKLLGAYSKGMRQRVKVAQALVGADDPRVPIEWAGEVYGTALRHLRRDGELATSARGADAMDRWCERLGLGGLYRGWASHARGVVAVRTGAHRRAVEALSAALCEYRVLQPHRDVADAYEWRMMAHRSLGDSAAAEADSATAAAIRRLLGE